MSGSDRHFHLFDVYGIEMEYMIVDKETLRVLPLTDEVIKGETGEYVSEFENGEIAWSNELVLHVIELKTNGPKSSLSNLAKDFQDNVNRINRLLQKHNAMLLPSGMHPFMDPFSEAKIWPHEYNEVYESYNRIFDCRGHGWSNLQSTHINLPFYDDEEFGMLHAAIRLILPVIPALSASSPVKDGMLSPFLDTRLEVYRHNQEKIPSVAGKIIPERAFTKKDYEDSILKKIYADIANYDENKILQNEWLNSRGAIARFERNAIEIRIIDNQECPKADIAIAAFIIEVLKLMIDEQWVRVEDQMNWDENALADIFLKTVKDAGNAVITNDKYLRCFGIMEDKISAAELWNHLYSSIEKHSGILQPVELILEKGSLATRICRILGKNPGRKNIQEVFLKLAFCLEKGEMLT